jgi:hypothetical protein
MSNAAPGPNPYIGNIVDDFIGTFGRSVGHVGQTIGRVGQAVGSIFGESITFLGEMK